MYLQNRANASAWSGFRIVDVIVELTTVVEGSATTTTKATCSSANTKISKQSRGRPHKRATTNDKTRSIEGKEIALKIMRNDSARNSSVHSVCAYKLVSLGTTLHW